MKILFSIFLLIISFSGFCQLEEEDQYVSEFTWGVTKNTNSGLIGGAAFKLSRLYKDNTYQFFGLDLVNVKHPKEDKRVSGNGSSFVWGKQHSLYSIRLTYGREHLWFKKAPQQGVQISTLFGGGPTIGLVAPYYVNLAEGFEPFNPNAHSIENIRGSGRYIKAIGESDIELGINAKAGVSFEFGPFKNNVAGIEAGVSSELFTKKIIIMPTTENKAWFNALYVTLYWGTRK